GLIAGAIGESGAAINPTFEPVPLAEAEKTGLAFATAAKADSLAALRAMPADAVLAVQGGPRFPITIDGYFLPKSVAAIFRARKRSVHRLQHLEVDRSARPDRRKADLSLLLLASAAGDESRQRHAGAGARRLALRRD